MLKSSNFYFLILTLAVTVQACSTVQTPLPATTKAAQQSQLSAVETPKADTQTVSLVQVPTPTIELMPSATPPGVTLTIVNGDLSIRTGPDMSFDAIAKLQDGDTVTALARSIMDGWVQVQIPSRTGETGWVSTQTNYAIVTGNLLDLPRIDAVEWNVGSYLINCTPHQMIVKPGDVILQPAGETDSRVWFTPGTYSVYDLGVTGQPVAANLTVTEHREFHILKDGNRKQWACPEETESVTANVSQPAAIPLSAPTKATAEAIPAAPTPAPDFAQVGLPAEEDDELLFDFVGQMCAAKWSTRGQDLPCPGNASQPSAGYVMKLDAEEQGLPSDMNILLAYTPQEKYETIYGEYPAVSVQKGDRFRAVLACKEHTFCDVEFVLNFSNERGSAGLKNWRYLFTDEPIVVDYPLDALAGETVQFQLNVRARGNPAEAYAVWIAPHIYRPAP